MGPQTQPTADPCPGELPFRSPWLLAPMEGVTDPCFRDLVLDRNPPEALGGAFTEFVRVVRDPLPRATLRAHLGPNLFEAPVGLQLMGSDRGAMAATAERAAEIGAPLVDLNFGCPAKGALRTCAGSALLDRPEEVETLVRACRDALPTRVPLTAKIRAGGTDDSLLEELARAAEEGGAAMLTVHSRTRAEGYAAAADWERLRRAVAAVGIPVCGNGGIEEHADFARMRSETGCAFAMVGRAALGDPWIFSGRRVSRTEAARFLVEYAREMLGRGGAPLEGAIARVKQLLRFWTAGDLCGEDRTRWLRERDSSRILARLEELASDRAPVPLGSR